MQEGADKSMQGDLTTEEQAVDPTIAKVARRDPGGVQDAASMMDGAAGRVLCSLSASRRRSRWALWEKTIGGTMVPSDPRGRRHDIRDSHANSQAIG